MAPAPAGGASLSDILTAAKNLVTALNSAAQTYLSVNGLTNSAGLTAATVVKSSPGRVATVSVIVAGSATGHIYDATSARSTSNPVYVIPMTVGVVLINMPMVNGIVVAPGSGQTVTIGYS